MNRLKNHFDKTLAEYLLPMSSTNSVASSDVSSFSIESPVLNTSFSNFEHHLKRSLKHRDARCMTDEIIRDELLYACDLHADKYTRRTDTDYLLVLVHPFYMHLSHAQHLNYKTQKEADEYLKTLFSLFELHQNQNNFGIVLLDTPEHYAAASSLLVERGVIDDVVFTKYDEGFVDVPKSEVRQELSCYVNKKLYFGGGYDGACLTHAIMQADKVVDWKNIFAISELCVLSPAYFEDSIRPLCVEQVDQDHELSINEFLKRVNNSSELEKKFRSKNISFEFPRPLRRLLDFVSG